MRKGNGKTDGELDLEHELPAAEGGEEAAPGSTAAKSVEIIGPGTAASETEKLKAERDALLDRLARLQAEFDNARKRALREQQEFREFAAADVIKNFLPILDSFERALKAEGDSSDFRNGIELIYRQFQDALQKIGVQRILSAGQPFDPRIHEAVEMVDTTEVPDHYVLDELQHGYKYKDRLLRPAMVRVARNSRG
ncbi:MAG TPA: nucleotide exchange factor GrpE [Terriglobales bacterium]|jgi:molecular chaperone GrpE|nr:nucleotide exchange factor GrpE [Terriglobales bacterium]